MLDTETKRRIDSCRDILVGKVPDPKSQVEQITIALIYKFMDDMDAESEELNGKRTFFAKEFARFGWAQLMASNLGGQDMLNLYSEAIARMNENPGVPTLFRDIFKNAYLPYRDPETLRAFLKEINGFNYDHSERLGDAFEYLLSVLGAQGDAGQFRTPRHLIDFLVEIIDPKKNETVLDPACGTAGFLISAYKHILRSNSKQRPGDQLLPEDYERLARNLQGYDISPDMVRLSLANLYLHGFRQPRIEEYDTLTSETHWNDTFDVVLANPPFMSPKGGIRPHKRFSMPSNRSEVLFVDYIAEHLSSRGRAAIIVPEGIISNKAFWRLRKLLLEDSLVCIISLPSGIFHPYTGVKTSVLILDKSYAKQVSGILFCDVKHVGITLSAKRAKTETNDLPQVLEDYKSFCLEGFSRSRISSVISKNTIRENNFSFDLKRFRERVTTPEGVQFVKLGEICHIYRGQSSSTKTIPGEYPLILTAEDFKTSATFDFDVEAVCVPLISAKGHGKASVKRVHYYKGKFALANLLAAVIPKDPAALDVRFLYYILSSAKTQLAALMSGAANVSMNCSDLASLEIPFPSLETQLEIAEHHQRIDELKREVVLEEEKVGEIISQVWGAEILDYAEE